MSKNGHILCWVHTEYFYFYRYSFDNCVSFALRLFYLNVIPIFFLDSGRILLVNFKTRIKLKHGQFFRTFKFIMYPHPKPIESLSVISADLNLPRFFKLEKVLFIKVYHVGFKLNFTFKHVPEKLKLYLLHGCIRVAEKPQKMLEFVIEEVRKGDTLVRGQYACHQYVLS